MFLEADAPPAASYTASHNFMEVLRKFVHSVVFMWSSILALVLIALLVVVFFYPSPAGNAARPSADRARLVVRRDRVWSLCSAADAGCDMSQEECQAMLESASAACPYGPMDEYGLATKELRRAPVWRPVNPHEPLPPDVGGTHVQPASVLVMEPGEDDGPLGLQRRVVCMEEAVQRGPWQMGPCFLNATRGARQMEVGGPNTALVYTAITASLLFFACMPSIAITLYMKRRRNSSRTPSMEVQLRA